MKTQVQTSMSEDFCIYYLSCEAPGNFGVVPRATNSYGAGHVFFRFFGILLMGLSSLNPWAIS